MPQANEDQAAKVDAAEIRPGTAPHAYGDRLQIEAKPGSLIEPGQRQAEPSEGLLIPRQDMTEVLARTAARKRRWVVQGVLAEGQYGTVGGSWGAGKSWAAHDAALSVATGTPWLDSFPCGQGRVCLIYGEGEEYEFARRTRAICKSKRVDPASLGGLLDVCFIPPDLSDPKVVTELGEWLDEVKPALVIVDPLYLMQGGVSGRNVAEMGGLLRGVTAECLRVGSALLTVTHFNKTGNGDGATRITGVGSQEWARVIITLSAEFEYPAPEDDPHDTRDVQLLMEFRKAVAGQYLVRRKVWSDDPAELDSPMHYLTRVYEYGGKVTETRTGDGLTPAQRKITAALAELGEGASAAALARKAGVDVSTVKRFRRTQREGGGR